MAAYDKTKKIPDGHFVYTREDGTQETAPINPGPLESTLEVFKGTADRAEIDRKRRIHNGGK